MAQTQLHEGSHTMDASEGSAVYPCPMLQAHHKQMTDKIAMMDQQLNQLVQGMKQAQGEQKVKAMESVLSTLVEQREVIHQEIISMMPKMMEYVSRHAGSENHECSGMHSSAQSSGQ